ncbi:MAG: DUF4114 domain-containing protein [Bacteroidetes bacterium]|nr:DUF4114 domain-containing protein [Bacteroidota bacterium]
MLTGWDGLTQADWKPTLTSGMTSAQVLTATAQFSITVGLDGSISGVSVTNAGGGYMATKGGNATVDFEIRGNDSYTAGSTNPNDYAIATLTFSGGKLTSATLKSPGKGYTYLAQANLATGYGNTVPFSTPQTDIIPINASLLESWYTVPYTDYQDWYLITDTLSSATARKDGNFGALSVTLDPASEAAKSIISSTPITTGYSGRGQQQKFSRAQTGSVTLVDSQGKTLGSGNLVDGTTSITLIDRPAPGLANIKFSGDYTSSFLTNFKASDTPVALNYGNWTGLANKVPGLNSISLSADTTIGVSRMDTQGGSVSFGISSGSSSSVLLNNANSAMSGVLTIDSIYNSQWLGSEGKSIGGSASARIAQGTWTPTATRNGQQLVLNNLLVNGNNVTATFSDNIIGTYTLSGTGTAINPSQTAPILTVQRLGGYNNSIAFYEADPITGSVMTASGTSLAPGSAGYLQAALANAKSKGLTLSTAQLPGYQQSAVIKDIPLNASTNYGILLLVQGSESNIYSSYSAANPGGINQFQSFGASDRGLTIGIEDSIDRDYNDLILTIASSTPLIA